MEQEGKIHEEMKTVMEFTCLGDRVSAGGGCDAAVTARKRCGWVKPMVCGKLLCGRIFPLKLKVAVYKSYVRPAIMCGSETWCLKERKMGILQRTERSMVIAMCGVEVKDRKRSKDLMLMLGLNEAIYKLTLENSVHLYGHVLMREDGHVLRRTLDFEVEGKKKKGRPNKTWKKQVEGESVKIELRMEDALCRSKWSVGINQTAVGLR